MSAERAAKSAWCPVLSILLVVGGCRFGYERLDIDDEATSVGFGANGSSVGGSGGMNGSSSGTGLEGGAPGDTADATGGVAGSEVSGGSAGSSAGNGNGSGGSAGAANGNGGTTGSAGAASGSGGGTSGSGGSIGSGGAGGASGSGGSTGSGGSAGAASGSGGTSGASSGGGAGGASGSGGSGAGTPPDMNLCIEDTYGGHDYLLCEETRTWADAVAGCLAVAMHLVRVDDPGENQWLSDNRNVSTKGSPPIVWIGASDQAVEGEWRWTDGDLFWSGEDTGMAENGLFSAWYTGEPNDRYASDDEDCGAFRNNSPEWYDVLCAQPCPYICESP